jgi:hypothetical protein
VIEANQATTVANTSEFTLHMAPVGAGADYLWQGNYSEAAISLAGDAAMFLGAPWAKLAVRGKAAFTTAKALNNIQKIGKAAVGLEGGIAVVRTGQGMYAVHNGGEGAAGYFGEAVLRLFGVATQFKSAFKKLDDVATNGGAISGVFPGARRVGGYDPTMLGQTSMNCGPSCVGVVLQRRGIDISKLNLGRFTSATGTNKRQLVKLLREGGISDSSMILRHRMTLPRLLDDLGEGRQMLTLIDNGAGGGHWVLVESVVERGGQQYIRLFDPSKSGFGRWDVPLSMFESRLGTFGGQGITLLP